MYLPHGKALHMASITFHIKPDCDYFVEWEKMKKFMNETKDYVTVLGRGDAYFKNSRTIFFPSSTTVACASFIFSNFNILFILTLTPCNAIIPALKRIGICPLWSHQFYGAGLLYYGVCS